MKEKFCYYGVIESRNARAGLNPLGCLQSRFDGQMLGLLICLLLIVLNCS